MGAVLSRFTPKSAQSRSRFECSTRTVAQALRPRPIDVPGVSWRFPLVPSTFLSIDYWNIHRRIDVADARLCRCMGGPSPSLGLPRVAEFLKLDRSTVIHGLRKVAARDYLSSPPAGPDESLGSSSAHELPAAQSDREFLVTHALHRRRRPPRRGHRSALVVAWHARAAPRPRHPAHRLPTPHRRSALHCGHESTGLRSTTMTSAVPRRSIGPEADMFGIVLRA